MRALPLVQLFVQYFLIPSAPVKCSYAYFSLLVLFSEVFCCVCLASRSPFFFFAGHFDLRAFLALCYFVLVACLPKIPAPIFRFSLLPWWPERLFYALVGLLTLRLPSLAIGWGYLAYPLPLKFVLFFFGPSFPVCFLVTTQGMAAFECFAHVVLFVFPD